MNKFGILSKPLLWSMAVLLSAFAAGCGGGGGGGGSVTTAVEGQGNFGAKIVGGTVQMVCAGSTAGTTVTTSATGAFTVVAPGSAPCVIKISGGNLVGGPFYSIFVAGQTRANVNQLTTMLAFLLADGNPETFFTTPSSISTKITTAAVATDKETVRASVIANLAGAVTPAISTSFDFLQTSFASDSTGFDQMLDKLGFTSTGNTAASITFNGAPILAVNPTTNVASTMTSTLISSTTLAAAGASGTAATATGLCSGASCVALGTAGNFVIFTQTGISNTGTSAVIGDMGVSPGAASTITGFALTVDATNDFSTSAQVTGSGTGIGAGRIYAPGYTGGQIGSNGLTPAKVSTAQTDLGTAYTNAAGKTSTSGCPGSGTFNGGTVPPLAPGVYTCATNVTIPANFTLTGTATDVWVFQITGTLTQSAATQVILTGGALPKNVFWQVSGAVTIGTTAVMKGVILAQTNIAVQNGATINGRLLAQTAVALDTNMVTQP